MAKLARVPTIVRGQPPPKRARDPKHGPPSDFGYIGLQNHDETSVVYYSVVYYKEVSVRPLRSRQGRRRARISG